MVLIGNDDKTSQSQKFCTSLTIYRTKDILSDMEQRQQTLLRQSAENFFGEDEENISERNTRLLRQQLIQESGTSEETKSEGTNAPIILVEKYAQFTNQFIDKPIVEQKDKLDEMRNSSILRALVRTAEDFTLEEEEKYALLFNEGDRLKRIWEYIYVSFNEQEILLTEPGYGNYCVDFDALKEYQKQTGYILKNSAYKVYKLFRFFVMKDPILHAVSREQINVTQVDVSANSAETPLVEMDIASENSLPKLRFTDTEKLMDDLSLTPIV